MDPFDVLYWKISFACLASC